MPFPPQRTAAFGFDVFVPIGLPAISERDHEAVLHRHYDDGDLIELSAFPTGVGKDGKHAQTFPGDMDQELIGEVFIENPDPVEQALIHG